jgi:cobalamin biosynthesis protein CobC
MTKWRDHGGGLDAAMARYGGARGDWIDLSTGINPVPYPVGQIDPGAWTALPDRTAMQALVDAARSFWQVPIGATLLAGPGASALIAQLPQTQVAGTVSIPAPTYNEHAAAFAAQGWTQSSKGFAAQVLVHPNNPTGRLWQKADITARFAIIDESFCDVIPDQSLISLAARPGTVILKSFGKFWGLAGLRLGFAIGDPAIIGKLTEGLGPWPVSGPALHIGAAALTDHAWATETRARLATDTARLDRLMIKRGAVLIGGTTLFRTYQVDSATGWQARLARKQIWSRVFPYSQSWLRLGLPHPDRWDQLESAL